MTRRLYLDTADLLDIGDGRVEAELLADLVAAMSDADARLVVSRDHVQDVSRGTPSVLESLVRGVESFGPVLVVMSDATEVEPLSADRTDIVVAPCTNFREVAYSDAARGPLDRMNVAYDALHAGDRAAHDASSPGLGSARVSKKVDELYVQCFVTLVRGWLGDDPETILAWWEKDLGVQLTPRDREMVLAALQRAGAMLAELRPVIAKESIDVTEALRQSARWQSDPEAWPGHALSYRVSANRRHAGSRKPRRSDLLDFDHVKHLPYVDVATCDGGTLHALGVVPRPAGPRAPVVLQNRKLRPVIDALRSGSTARR